MATVTGPWGKLKAIDDSEATTDVTPHFMQVMKRSKGTEPGAAISDEDILGALPVANADEGPRYNSNPTHNADGSVSINLRRYK